MQDPPPNDAGNQAMPGSLLRTTVTDGGAQCTNSSAAASSTSTDPDFLDGILCQLANAGSRGAKVDERGLNPRFSR